MLEHSRLPLILAFFTGVVLTLGFKDVYPDLERRFRQRLDGNSKTYRRRFSIFPGQAEGKTLSLQDRGVGSSQDDRTESLDLERREGIESCIGNTPLIRIKSLSEATGCEILAKAEFLNGCGGSPKDRVALRIIEKAEREGLLVPNSGDTIYEGTVGSTGISLAMICRAKGYRACICMPSDQAKEKSDLLQKLGAVVERVPPVSIIDPMHFVNRARNLAAEHTASSEKTGRGFFADQFESQANWQAHFRGTGPEIFEQCNGKLDAFVAGAGTGGTITGVARYLKPKLPKIKIVLADPQGSGLLNRVKYGVMFDPKEKEGTRRRHQVDSIVEGIGVNRVTANFESGRHLIDDALRVTDDVALRMARWLAERDGIFTGGSGAVNCELSSKATVHLTSTGATAAMLAEQLGPGHKIVTILCDSGQRHLSRFWAAAGDVGDEMIMSLHSVLKP